MMHEVVSPNMIDVLRSKTNARSVIEPGSASLRLFHGNLEPLTTPQTFDSLVVQLLPSCISQHGCDPTITVTPILTGPFGHVPDQAILIVSGLWNITVRRAMLLQDPAGAAFGNIEPPPHQVDTVASPRGA